MSTRKRRLKSENQQASSDRTNETLRNQQRLLTDSVMRRPRQTTPKTASTAPGPSSAELVLRALWV